MRLLERRFMTKKGPLIDRMASRDDALVGKLMPISTATQVVGDDDDDDTTLDKKSVTSLSESVAHSEAIPLTDQVNKKDEILSRWASKTRCGNDKSGRQLDVVNSLDAIKLKMFIYVLVFMIAVKLSIVQAGMLTFYFPNMLKPKAYAELTEMVKSLEDHINSTKDNFADIEYFWGTLKNLDENRDQERSVCSKVLPKFRELAIEYIYIDYEHYIQPKEEYRQYLIEFRDEWYPRGKDSKAPLSREWEQKLLETELQMKIDSLVKLINEPRHRHLRQEMVDIWKNVKRSLDRSLECIYLRSAFKNIAQDINEIALETNLMGMRKAMTLVISAYKRIAKFKASDERIVAEVKEELKKHERFAIRE